MTLIEMLLVLAILGILFGLAASVKPWAFDGRRIAEDSRRLLQTAKSEASKRNRSVWVQVNDGEIRTFTGSVAAGCTVSEEDPVGSLSASEYRGGFSFSSSYENGLFRFNPQGFPRDCYGNPLAGEIDIVGSGRKLCVSLGGSLRVVKGGACP